MFGIGGKKLNPLAGIGRREAVAIDFGDNSLKLAHLRISGRTKEIIDLFNCNISGLSDTDTSKLIATSFDGFRAKTREVISIIPAHLAITKNIELPATNPQEIKEIINLQAGRHTPYSREEIIVDYINIGTYKHNYSKILLVIVARNILKRHFDILSRAGLKLSMVLFSPECLALSAFQVLKIRAEESPVGIIHIDENFTDFIVIFKNKALFVRPIPIGMQHLTAEKERYQIKFVEETKKSLEAYQSEDIEKTPNMLLLTGPTKELNDLEAILNSDSHIPVKVVPYFRNLVISEKVLKVASEASQSSFLNVIASLFAKDEVKVNLVPEEIKLKKTLEERGRDLIKMGIFILTIFVLVFLILINNIYFKSAYLKELTARYEKLGKEAQVLERDFTKVGLIKNYLINRGFSLEVLNELYSMAPLDLELSDIKYDEQGKFSIRGTAETMSTVFTFVDSMKKSKYFKDVKTKYTAKRKEGTKDVADFEVGAFLNKDITK